MKIISKLAITLFAILMTSCGNQPISNIRVVSAQPTEIKVNSELFPLPNCGGTSPLSQTLGTHAAITKSVTVGAKAALKGGGEVDIPELAKLDLEIGVEGYYQKTFESANSRLDQIDMTAAEGTHVVYEIGWYEESFESIVQYASDGQVYEVPYIYKLRIPKIDSSNQVSCLSTPSDTSSEVKITIWYAYNIDTAEETVLNQIVQQAEADLPGTKIDIVQVPFSDIYNNYSVDVAAGAGPDMFIVPNDSLGDEVRAGLIADITDLAAGKLGNYSQLAIDGMSVNGRLYGIPESQKAVAFWYNKELLAAPPATTDELRALMEAGTPISVSYGCYHHFGFFGAFGGKIFDNNWKIVADQGNGITSAMNYLNDLYQISKLNGWPTTDYDGLVPFTEGRMVGIINGNWAMGDYQNVLGNKLGVAPLPAGPNGPASPMLGIDGFYFNPNSTNKEIALEVALYLTNKQSQTIMMNEAGHVPVNTSAEITNPLIESLVTAFENSYVRPQSSQIGKYWGNFCNTDQVFEAGMSAENWVAEATANANR